MKKSALDKAAMRLQENPYILARFKRNPRSALAQYQLADDDVAALQRGDTMELIGRGLDWRIPFARPISRPLFSSILMTNAGKMAPALFAGLVLALWPTLASADQTLAARRLRFLSDNPRISRRRARRRVVRIRRTDRALRRLTRLNARRIGRRRAITNVGDGGYCIPPFCPE